MMEKENICFILRINFKSFAQYIGDVSLCSYDLSIYMTINDPLFNIRSCSLKFQSQRKAQILQSV